MNVRVIALTLLLSSCPNEPEEFIEEGDTIVTFQRAHDLTGFRITRSGRKSKWRREDIPITILVHHTARDWLPMMQNAVNIWNRMADCELFYPEVLLTKEDIFKYTETSTSPTGTFIPVFQHYASGDPHTNFEAIDGTGQLTASSVWMVKGSMTKKIAVLISMHELGHVLGLDHDEDPSSLMYPKIYPSNSEAVSPTVDDLMRVQLEYCLVP